MSDELVRAIAERQAILFVGAGVSAGLGAPTWSQLIRQIARELDYDPDIFAPPDANPMTLAEYYRIRMGSLDSLRRWMNDHWNATDEQLRASRVHQAIVDLDFPIIYTTNYDRNIEHSFQLRGKPFRKIVDVGDLARLRNGETQIVKLHGDFDNDCSVVLTETDHFDRLTFDSPLDIKFRSDSLARSILFIGYSLTDINIRLLLHRLWRTWENSGQIRHRPKSYIFLVRPDEIQQAVLAQWNVEALTEDVDDPGDALQAFLEGLVARTGAASG